MNKYLALFDLVKMENDYQHNGTVTNIFLKTAINLLPTMDKSVQVSFETDKKRVTIDARVRVEYI